MFLPANDLLSVATTRQQFPLAERVPDCHDHINGPPMSPSILRGKTKKREQKKEVEGEDVGRIDEVERGERESETG